MQAKTVLRRSSNAVLLVSALILGGYTILLAQARVYQAVEKRQFDSELHKASRTSGSTLEKQMELGTVLGNLQIPRIGVHVLVLEGVDAAILRRAAGHIPGTAMPDDSAGNTGIAAHRNTFFRPLRNIRRNDLILLQTLGRTYSYRVTSTQIVEPTDVAVLDATGQRTLTLVTCFPFEFVGSAPDRFIVRADQVSSK